ncbi:hypothetical protein J7K50_03200 [bacterium]|nr:hypothetical protein [bacterium]
MKAIFSNWVLKMWAIVFAIALSAYVNTSYQVTETINAPLIIIGLSNDLVIASEIPDTVSIQIRGILANISQLRKSPPNCEMKLASFKVEGLYEDVSVSVPELGGTEVVKGPSPIDIVLKKKIQKTFVVEANRIGSLPADFIEQELSITPESVKVTGAQENIEQVKHAVAEIDLVGSRRNVTRFIEVKLLDENLRLLPMERFTLDSPKVRCDLRVSSLSNVKLLRLFPNIKGEPPENYAFNVEIEPRHIPVPIDYLEGMDVSILNTEPINLTDVKESFKREVEIVYPFEQHELLQQKAVVNVTLVDITSSQEASLNRKIEIIGSTPGVSVLVQPTYIWIGSSEITLLTESERENIRAIVDIEGLEPGEYLIRPQVILDPKVRNASILPLDVKVEIGVGVEDQ